MMSLRKYIQQTPYFRHRGQRSIEEIAEYIRSSVFETGGDVTVQIIMDYGERLKSAIIEELASLIEEA